MVSRAAQRPAHRGSGRQHLPYGSVSKWESQRSLDIMKSFDRATADSLTAIARHGPTVNVDLTYDGLRVHRCDTLVICVPSLVGERVMAAMASFRRLNPQHHVYPVTALHVTVADVTRATLAGHDIETLLAVAREVVGSMPTFDLNLCGIAVLPYSLIVPVAPEDNGAARLSAALTRALSAYQPQVQPPP